MSRPTPHGLPLPYAVTLLLHKTHGGRYAGTNRDVVVAAAEFGELVLRHRIAIDRKRLRVLDPSPVGLPWCDELLAELARKAGPHSRPFKLASFLQQSRRFQVYRAALAESGLLVRTTNTFLGFIPYERYFAHAPTHEALLDELVQVARAQRPVDNRLALLTAVVHSGGLVRPLGFGSGERRTMKSIAKGEHLGGAVEAAVVAASAGITAAAIPAGGAGGDGGGGDGGGGG